MNDILNARDAEITTRHAIQIMKMMNLDFVIFARSTLQMNNFIKRKEVTGKQSHLLIFIMAFMC